MLDPPEDTVTEETEVTVAVAAAPAKTNAATPTATVDTTVAATAFCGAGTHTVEVMFEVSWLGADEVG